MADEATISLPADLTPEEYARVRELVHRIRLERRVRALYAELRPAHGQVNALAEIKECLERDRIFVTERKIRYIVFGG